MFGNYTCGVHVVCVYVSHTLQVELPLGATEDRICGTIDIEKALSEGVKAYEPGLLVSERGSDV